MPFRCVLISSSGHIPPSLQDLVQQQGFAVLALPELLDVPWQHKPDTLFFDVRQLSAAEINSALQVFSANFSGTRVVILHDHGFPLDSALSVMLEADAEWDLRLRQEPDQQWLQLAAGAVRPAPFRLAVGSQNLLTWHPEVHNMLQTASRLSDSRVPLLLSGETGTGKSTTAQTIHRWSTRAQAPFVFFPCGAVSRDLIYAELFGHRRGAFTGAIHDRVGKIEAAGTGTLLIDEVDLLTLDDQAKLLRVVETGQYERIGTVETSMSQCRLIFASNVDLAAEVRAGRFRSDLYFRINVLELHLVPLRNRLRDIPLIAIDCLHNLAAEHNVSAFNQTHKFVAYGVWSGPLGIQLSPIFRANSGRPFNLLAGVDVNADRHNTTDRPIGAPRNSGQGPAFYEVDLRASKRVKLGEKASAEFTAETFNMFNHLNYSSVNNTVGLMPGPFNVTGRDDRRPSDPLGFTSAFDPRRFQLGVRLSF